MICKLLLKNEKHYNSLLNDAKSKGYKVPVKSDKLPYALVIDRKKKVLNNLINRDYPHPNGHRAQYYASAEIVYEIEKRFYPRKKELTPFIVRFDKERLIKEEITIVCSKLNAQTYTK